MSLTPVDIHNVVFRRSRIGTRGYREEDVDLVLELVEDELVRHIEEKDELRKVIAVLRNRDAAYQKTDAELRQWDGELRQWDAELRQWDHELRKQEAELRRYQAALKQKAAQLRRYETTRQQRKAALQHKEAALHPQESVVRRNGGPVRGRREQQRAAVSEEQRITAVRTVAGVHGKRDMEWTAIRTVADLLGHGMTETVQQGWTRTTETDQGSPWMTSIESAQMRQLQQENAVINRVNEILKAAAALFANQIQEP